MVTTLFLQSEVRNPYEVYKTMHSNPVYWDSSNKLWAIYSYEGCKALLRNPLAHIPANSYNNGDGLNEYGLLIASKLARLNNGGQHEMAKQAVVFLFNNRKVIATNEIIEKLIKRESNNREMDWVDSICKKLPLMAVLKSFDFNEPDCDFILSKTDQLVKIMLPDKTTGQIASINEISKEIYTITEKHLSGTGFYKPLLNSLSEKYKTGADETASLCVSNLIGFFIQGYDAGRGILSNSLLQVINNCNLSANNFGGKDYFEKNIVETLRFDPPVHNTRRVAADSIIINNMQIKKGQTIFIVLAAANRDPQQFNNPDLYNIERPNNAEHLTFGIGSHKCPANYLSVTLARETLAWFFDRYKKIQLIEKDILYEPMINARLPKHIFISLS